MSTRVTYDFTRPATLSQNLALGASNVFDGTSEIGRASGLVGSSDDVTVLLAGRLGSWANNIRYSVLAPGGDAARVEYDYGTGLVRAFPGATDTANDVVAALNLDPRDPRVTVATRNRDDIALAMRLAKDPWVFRAVTALGDGTDPPATGTATLSGGLDPVQASPNYVEFGSETDNGGLFSFDAADPLKLVQFVAVLSGSTAWALTLRPLWETDYAVPLASGTGQFVRVDVPVVVLPGWALGFEAAVQGRAYCTVARY